MTVQAIFNGQIITQPGSRSQVISTGLNTTQVSFGGICAVIGASVSGPPKVPVPFTSGGNLKDALGSGQLYDAMRVMFAPSNQIVEGSPVRPQLIYAVRADTATQSTITLKDASAVNSVTLTAADYGVQTNLLSATVAASTVSQANTPPTNDTSKKVVINFGSVNETYDNLGVSPIFHVQFAGSGTCTMTISSTAIVTTASVGTSVNFPYTQYPTIKSIVDAFNATTGYTAVADTTDPSSYLAVNLDYIAAAQDIKTTVRYFYAVINDIVTTINRVSNLVTATRHASGVLPPTTSGPTMFTGGATTAPTNTDFLNALTALQEYRVNQVVSAASVSSASGGNGLGTVFTAWADAMQGRNECHVHLGAVTQQSYNTLKSLSAELNDVNANLWFQDVKVPNDQGLLTTYGPWMMAAIAAGCQAGMPIGSSFVAKSFNILGIDYLTTDTNLNPSSNADNLILNRLSFVKFKDSTKAWTVVRALTTSFSTNDGDTEPGIRDARNHAVYDIRKDIEDKFLGSRTLFTDAGSTADSIKSELIAFGNLLEKANIIIKGTVVQNNTLVTLPALVIDNISISGDTVRLRYGIRPIGSINFIFHTVTLNSVQQTATA